MSNYREIAFSNSDFGALDEWGWDIIAEGVSATCLTREDYRTSWKGYQAKFNAATGDAKRFYAWAMLYVESEVKHRLG